MLCQTCCWQTQPRHRVSAGLLSKAYENEPFVVVCEESPATKAVQHSNEAHLTARYDSRTGYMIVLCAIDNLGKGAAGQAIQCANLICNFPEETGLTSD